MGLSIVYDILGECSRLRYVVDWPAPKCGISDDPPYRKQIQNEVLLSFAKNCKGKAVPLQAWSGPEGPRKLRFPDFMTTAQDGCKVVSPTHRPLFTPRKYSWHSYLLESIGRILCQ